MLLLLDYKRNHVASLYTLCDILTPVSCLRCVCSRLVLLYHNFTLSFSCTTEVLELLCVSTNLIKVLKCKTLGAESSLVPRPHLLVRKRVW